MKILLTSVSAGAGHVRAAQALEAAFEESFPSIQVSHIDAIEFVSRTFRKLYIDGYVRMVNDAPTLWGYLYDVADRKVERSRTKRLVEAVQRYNAPRLLQELERQAPDRIVTTHYFVPQVLSRRLRKGRFPIPIDVVVTDYDLHRFWLARGVSRYFVATEMMAHRLRRAGVEPERINVSGIPIHPVFTRPIDLGRVRTKFELVADVPTLLLLAGGLGMGALDQVVRSLFSGGRALQIISVAGRNAELRRKLGRLQPLDGIRFVNLGFVTNMHELMSVADLVVTKPGGLTTSECLALETPMVVLSPIPGQEERNSDYLLEAGAGLKAQSLEELEFKLSRLLADPRGLARMKSAARRVARPDAAHVIAERVALG